MIDTHLHFQVQETFKRQINKNTVNRCKDKTIKGVLKGKQFLRKTIFIFRSFSLHQQLLNLAHG